MNVLVAGGAGYIGSHAVKLLVEAGHRVVVVDNLVYGHLEAVHPEARMVRASLSDQPQLAQALEGIDCVMHFAAFAMVGESVREPLKYYRNNVAETLSLLEGMQAAGVPRMVFSSTCAIYGEPRDVPICEDLPAAPVNPYGRSKWMVEQVLADCTAANPEFGCACLRYFNVAGAAADGTLGEDHTPETHVIPLLLQTALGQRAQFTIFGDDYPTPDGTCIRDYIHVEDLCAAHLLAMEQISPGEKNAVNLGIGRGYSVQDVISACRRVTGAEIPCRFGERRPGDPAALYADASRARSELGWAPQHTELDDIVETAWRWYRAHPSGYAGQTASAAVR